MPTHRSLTKAGKVRGQTPKIEGKKRIGKSPRIRNGRNFIKRHELNRTPGQNPNKRVYRR